MKNSTFRTLTALMIITALAGTSSAVSIGAGPSTIDYDKLVKGGYAERTVTVSTSGAEDLICSVEFTGDIKNWLSIEQGTSFTLPANTRLSLKTMIKPPADAENGKYQGMMYIKAAPTSEASGGAGLIVGAGVGIKITAEITGEEIIDYRIQRTSVSNTEIGYPIKFGAIVANTGNVKVQPPIKVEIFDELGQLKKTYTRSIVQLMPTTESTINFEVPSSDLEVGKYSAKVRIGTEEQSVTFNILEKGTLALKGILKSVEVNNIFVGTGDPVKITAYVENTGELTIQGAKLDIDVYIDDEVYKTKKLVTHFTNEESRDIVVGETTELNAYYTPSKPGRYTISGAITYSGKKTQPKSTILNVYEKPKDYTLYIIAAVIVIILAVYWLTKTGEDGRTRRFRKIWGDYLQIK